MREKKLEICPKCASKDLQISILTDKLISIEERRWEIAQSTAPQYELLSNELMLIKSSEAWKIARSLSVVFSFALRSKRFQRTIRVLYSRLRAAKIKR